MRGLRRALTITAAVAVVLAMAAPAHAKAELIRITISGPGLGSPLSFRPNERFPFDETLNGYRGNEPKKGECLGPRYTMTWEISYRAEPGEVGFVPPPDASATQDLYPYARGGPWTYTAVRGEVLGLHYPGWTHASPDVLALLVSKGLPARSPEPCPAEENAAAVAPVAPSSEGGAGTRIWVAVGVLAVLLLVGALSERRQRALRAPGS